MLVIHIIFYQCETNLNNYTLYRCLLVRFFFGFYYYAQKQFNFTWQDQEKESDTLNKYDEQLKEELDLVEMNQLIENQ